MIAFVSLLLSALSLSSVVRADPNPTTPDASGVYNVGSNCPIAWDADTTGVWTKMHVELMTGDNEAMVHLTTVATVDATKTSSYSWTCPDVTPNSAIYFYQFTSPFSKSYYWTTRFTIASTTGATTPPTNSTQPGSGAQIPWGTGAFVDPSQETPAPTDVGSQVPANSSSSSASSSGASSVLPASSITSVTPVASPTVTGTGSPSSVSYKSATSTSSASAASSSVTTNGGLQVGFIGQWTLAALGIASTAFVFAL